jgi:hypothetical protein
MASRSRAALLNKRFANTAAVFARCRQFVDSEQGCSMSFPRSSAWLRRLEAFRESWQESCPDMRFQIDQDGDPAAFWLRVAGPEGTREWLRNARTILLSDINPPRDLRYRLRRVGRTFTSALRVLPDFLIIGGSKCGTTSLFACLTGHPGVRAPMQKEIAFFDVAYAQGLHWYRSFFPLRGVGRSGRTFLTGEATPDYLFHPDSPQRVQADLPRVKCIVLLRDPVDRAHSSYHFSRRAGMEEFSFEEALEREEQRLDPNHPAYPLNRHFYSYKARGRYAGQIDAWQRHVSAGHLLILGTEEFSTEPAATLDKVLDFLELPTYTWDSFPRLNPGPYAPMSAATRQKLAQEFAPHNAALYALIGRDLGWTS